MKINIIVGRKLLFLFLIILSCSFKNSFAQSHLVFSSALSQYVLLEPNTTTPPLGAASFTIEVWFYWTGNGITVSTGGSGITAIPLLTKGMAETDGSTSDMNYFLGISNQSGNYVLAADFEEDGTSPNPGRNHPLIGSLIVNINSWHHAAATYDNTTGEWKLYLDGNLDASMTLAAGITPQFQSKQHAALATATISDGTPSGFFDGKLDEARIWNIARTQNEIQSSMNIELTSGTGLLGRWGLNDGSGSTAVNSIAGSPDGTLYPAGSLPAWESGNFIVPSAPPADPSNLLATTISSGQIDLSWTDNSSNETYFKIKRSTDNSTFNVVAQVPANVISYSDHNLDANTQYFYQVVSNNQAGDSGPSNTDNSITSNTSPDAIQFDGSSNFISFGLAQSLNTESFTVEIWFNRSGTGVATSTGALSLVPLIAKGMAENDNPGHNINYFLGINSSSQITADFEDLTGANYPITGSTIISNGIWYHAAFTYNSSTGVEALYINGNLQTSTTLTGTPTPDYNTLQYAALGSALGTNGQIPPGETQGFFNGKIDLTRIWNRALTQSEIQLYMNAPLNSYVTGLLAQWSMDEGTGTFINSSAGTDVYGTFMGGMTSSNFVTSDNPFPVELVSFNAIPIKDKIKLEWQTATEVNNYGFEIQKSSNLINNDSSNWESIGFVKGNGNSNSPKEYTFTDDNLLNATKFEYRLKQIDNDGKFEFSKTIEISLTPTKFKLFQNYPNPFNPNTKIVYEIQSESNVQIKVFDILGNEIKTLVSGKQVPGTYQINFNADQLSSGIYFYTIHAGKFSDVKKMIIMK